MATKKGKTILLLLFFFAIVGSGYRDQGSRMEKIRMHNTGFVCRKYFVKLLYCIHEHLFQCRVSESLHSGSIILPYWNSTVTLTRLSGGEDAPSRVRSLRALAALKLSSIYFLSGRRQSIIGFRNLQNCAIWPFALKWDWHEIFIFRFFHGFPWAPFGPDQYKSFIFKSSSRLLDRKQSIYLG
jgi:hypothetical protein